MKIPILVEMARSLHPTPYSDRVLLNWISELDGQIQAEVALLDPSSITPYEMTAEGRLPDTELYVPHPYDRLYIPYLLGQMSLYENEFEEYQNRMQTYNEAYLEYVKFCCETVNPGAGQAEREGYYITAYSIAVKHGFSGTEEEWLASLRGEIGPVFTPQVAEISGGHRLFWTNDGGKENPEPFDILNGEAAAKGATFTPAVTETAEGHKLSWTNDQNLENPADAVIRNGKNTKIDRVTASVELTTEAPTVEVTEGGTEENRTYDFGFGVLSGVYVGSGNMPEGCNVKVNPEGDEVFSMLPAVSGADNGKYAKVVNGEWNVAEGSGGGGGDNGATFIPHLDRNADNTGWKLTWSNDRGLPNPDPVDIPDGQTGPDGTTFTPALDAVTGGHKLSWSNDGGKRNPADIVIKDGEDGLDGTTPARGVDYWTAADQQSIVNDVLAALPEAERQVI